jgi:hypothetical protein
VLYGRSETFSSSSMAAKVAAGSSADFVVRV